MIFELLFDIDYMNELCTCINVFEEPLVIDLIGVKGDS